MKIKLILFLFIAFQFSVFSQCPSGSITFYNQVQLDNFLVQYPNCTEITGSIIIDGNASNHVTSLSPLQNITTIQGDFYINYDLWLQSLVGLESLTEIGGNLTLTETSLLSIAPLSNLSIVGGNITLGKARFTDLTPFNGLTNLGGSFSYTKANYFNGSIDLNFNLTNIPGDFLIRIWDNNTLPDNFSVAINGLGSLTSVNGDVTIESKIITSIPFLQNLSTVGGDFTIQDIKMTNLSEFSSLQSIGGDFKILYSNHLTSLSGMPNLNSINDGLYIDYNTQLSNITNLNQISSLNGNLYCDNNPLITTLNGLENITSLNGTIHIENNANLQSITDLSSINESTITDLLIYLNPNLTLCHTANICNYLFNGGTNNINYNGGTCTTYDDLTQICNETYKNKILGNVSIDIIGTDCADDSHKMEHVKIKVTNGTDTFTTFTDVNGDYQLFVMDGNFNVELITNVAYYSPSPASFNLNFTGIGNEEIVDFCVAATQTIDDVATSFAPLTPPRPGFNITYRLRYHNIGTTIKSGDFKFNFDDSQLTFISATTTPDIQTPGEVKWNYTNMYPFESEVIYATFNVLQPPIVNINDIINTSTTINPITGDTFPDNNQYSLSLVVVGSYDPNDKQSLKGNVILNTQLDEYIYYMVRFQNTGTADAINVKVVDVIENTHNINSFQLVALSHPGYVQLNNNDAEFIFNNINLPDSTTDEPNSHGYIIYKIKSLNTNTIGNTLENTASIYFDFNEAIITNTTRITIDGDSDNDSIYDSIDNCINTANTDQLDTDNDGIGDVCDDEIEVDAPYLMGFDDSSIDSFWETRVSGNGTQGSSSINSCCDIDNNGNTAQIASTSSNIYTKFISPRLKNLSTTSVITFGIREVGATPRNVRMGFAKDQSGYNYSILASFNPSTQMSMYTVNLTNYNVSMGNNFIIIVNGKSILIDDFSYTNNNLSENDLTLTKLNIYPNPTKNLINISSDVEFNRILVYNYTGKVVKNIGLPLAKANYQFSINNLEKGVYFIKVETINSSFVKQIIKN